MSLSLTSLEEAWGNKQVNFKKKKNKYTSSEYQQDFLKNRQPETDNIVEDLNRAPEEKLEVKEPPPSIKEESSDNELVITLVDPAIVKKYKIYNSEYLSQIITQKLIDLMLSENEPKINNKDIEKDDMSKENMMLLAFVIVSFFIVDILTKMRQ